MELDAMFDAKFDPDYQVGHRCGPVDRVIIDIDMRLVDVRCTRCQES